MKEFRKCLCFLLITLIVLTCSAPSFAGTSGSININNAVNGQTYTIYRLLDLESYDTSVPAYAYKVATKWSEFFKASNNTGALNYVSIDSQGYVTWKTDKNTPDDYAAFAKLALDYATLKNISNDGKKVASTTTLAFSSLPLGYYLVDTSLGALCSLNTTNPTATIYEKNCPPTIQKLVKEGSEYVASNDASIGDTVNFKTIITAQAGAENYVMHDKMSAGLKWKNSVSVLLNGTVVSAGNYTVRTSTTTPSACSGCTFDVVFSKNFCDGLKANDIITVSYDAVLTKDAVIGTAGNSNKVWMEYGNNNTTVPCITLTRTWEINVFKYSYCTTGESGERGLANAVFQIKKGTQILNLVRDNINPNLYRVCTSSDCGGTHTHINQITTDSTGKFNIQGLDSGTYYLVEIQAPAGYNKIGTPIEIIIGTDGKVNATDENPEGVSQIKILNQTGSILPETGDSGVETLYLMGGLMMASAAGLYLLVRRKKVV